MRARIVQRIDRLERGNFGDHRDLGKGVSELRLAFGPGYRVYFGHTENSVVVLLGGGDNSSQRKDIERAHLLWEKFLASGNAEDEVTPWSEDAEEEAEQDI